MQHAATMLDQLGVAYGVKVVSAHRTPDLLFDYAKSAASRGLKVIIAGAGGAAHCLACAPQNPLYPVLGVPVQSRALNGLDSLLSIVQMPGGVPSAPMAIGDAGAKRGAVSRANPYHLDAALFERVGFPHQTTRQRRPNLIPEQTNAQLRNPL